MSGYTNEEFARAYEATLDAAKESVIVFNHLLYPQDSEAKYLIAPLHEYLFTIFEDTIKGKRSIYQTISLPPQHGKLLAHSTPVFTKNKGWVTHGDLAVGDTLFKADGGETSVIATMPESYADCEVEFTNGDKIKCHRNHEWTVVKGRRSIITLETKELLDADLWVGEKGNRGSRAIYQLPLSVDCPNKEKLLPIDPYFFGLWLGDGKSSRPQITFSNEDKGLEYRLAYAPTSTYSNGGDNKSYHCYFGKQSLSKRLKELRVLNNKHIPNDYLMGSVSQRLQLLAGLVDSDGTLHKKTKQYRIVNTNKEIVDGVGKLLSSLGVSYSESWKPACTSSSGIVGSLDVCQIGFTLPYDLPSKLSRKQTIPNNRSKRKVAIKSVRVLSAEEQELGRCIQVSNEDGLYRAGKTMQVTHNSQAITVRCVAWYLGAYKNKSVALTGFSYSLLKDFLRDIKEIIESDTYRDIFPDAKISDDGNTLDQFFMTNGNEVIIKSAGSKLTGRPVDLLIMDDVHAGRAEAESETQRKKVKQWYNGDCLTRLTQTANIFLIGTRWHPQDLIGELTSDEYIQEVTDAGALEAIYEVTNLTAICESEDDPLGREIGEALFPEKKSKKFLNRQKATTASYEWLSQYQGQPTSSGSDQVDISKLEYCELDDVPFEAGVTRRGWDLAVTEKTASDFTAGGLVCIVEPTEAEKELEEKDENGDFIALPTMYIVNMAHHKLSWARMKPKIVDIALADLETYESSDMGMEAVSGFKIGLDELRNALKGKVSVKEKNPSKGGKLIRAQPWLNLIEAEKVYLVRGSWNKGFVEELRTFPDGKHDDRVDAISVAYETIKPKKAKLLLA